MKIQDFFSGIRGKLIAIFVLIKVLPLLLLAWFAWHAARNLGEAVSSQASAMADATLETVGSVGKTVPTTRFAHWTCAPRSSRGDDHRHRMPDRQLSRPKG